MYVLESLCNVWANLYLFLTVQGTLWWLIQTELEWNRKNGLHDIMLNLSHCTWTGNGTRNGSMTNGLPRHFCALPHEKNNLNVYHSHSHCQCEHFSVLLFPIQVPVPFNLCLNNGLIRQSLSGTETGTGTGTEKNGSLYIMLNTSHCNLCGNLTRTYMLALYLFRSRSSSHISSVWLDQKP